MQAHRAVDDPLALQKRHGIHPGLQERLPRLADPGLGVGLRREALEADWARWLIKEIDLRSSD